VVNGGYDGASVAPGAGAGAGGLNASLLSTRHVSDSTPPPPPADAAAPDVAMSTLWGSSSAAPHHHLRQVDALAHSVLAHVQNVGRMQSDAEAQWAARHRAKLSTAHGRRCECAERCLHIAMVLVQLLTVIGAFTQPSFTREVHGAARHLLLAVGVDFTEHVSLIQLPPLVAQGGGLDYFMASTFAIFLLVTPILRALSLLALLTVPMRPSTARWLHLNSKRIVSYTARRLDLT
jgi:hypothetical protein